MMIGNVGHWFGVQTNVQMPISSYPAAGTPFRDYLFGWQSLPK